jgi:hypothetical protein
MLEEAIASQPGEVAIIVSSEWTTDPQRGW